MVKCHRDLLVWQKAMDLVVETYRLIRSLPKEENYALADQMRRAVVSIPSNIAEGKGRTSLKDYLRFLAIANGSCSELDTQIELAIRLRYFSEEQAANSKGLLTEVGKMLTVMQVRLNNPKSES